MIVFVRIFTSITALRRILRDAGATNAVWKGAAKIIRVFARPISREKSVIDAKTIISDFLSAKVRFSPIFKESL